MLSMPEDLSATGDGNFLANLTNKKFDVENPTGAGPTVLLAQRQVELEGQVELRNRGNQFDRSDCIEKEPIWTDQPGLQRPLHMKDTDERLRKTV